MNRRQLLKHTIGGSVLALTGVTGWQLYLEWQSESEWEPMALTFLDADRQMLLVALIPVFCQGMPVVPASASVLTNIDQAIVRLPQRTQAELADLFNLLTNLYGRLLLAQQIRPWSAASSEQLNAFLTSWREHSLSLLQIGYKGLHQLIIGAVYAEPVSWSGIGYTGPPTLSAAYPIETAGDSV